MELDQGLKLALDGRGVLFLGAGFSRGATNLASREFSSGADLAARLSADAKLPEPLALDDAAEVYAQEFGVAKLVDELKSSFSGKAVADFHKRIAAVPWRRVYTTNYDDVFELACREIGKRVDAVIPDDDISKISKKNLICVHLNGLIARTNELSIWSDLKLTQSSYDSGSAIDSEWGSLFRSDLQAAQAVFFVGYSLSDLDIRRLLFEEQLIDKSFFALGKGPDLATATRVSKYGLLIAANTQEFAGQLVEFGKKYVPEKDPTPISFCLSLYEATPAAAALEDRNIFELLLFGRLRPEFVTAGFLRQIKYCGPRKANELALTRLEAGTRMIVLHSSLGNGKTIALEELKFLAHSRGYKVFTLVNRGDSLEEEVQNALVQPGKKAVFVDNYVEWLDVFPLFGAHRSEDFSLIVSARSSSNDVLIDRLSRDFGTGDIFEIPVDELTSEDIRWVVSFFDEFGIWGDKASLSALRKERYLAQTCGGEWSGILLKILESPHIVEKLQGLFSDLKKSSPYSEPIIGLLILTVLAYRPETPVLVDLCGDKILEGGFRKDPVAKELVDFGRTTVGMRSSVTAEVLLRQVVDPNLVVKALIGLITRADKLSHASTFNYELFKNLVRFSNLHFMFAEKERGRAGMRVYESVKNLPACKRSPLFWLQYGIAALVSQDFDRAKSYFDNAYAFAGEMYEYDSFQIDNHYARFLIERAVARHDSKSAMSAFREARGLLFPQLAQERRHYPFRAASRWGNFYLAFQDELTGVQKAEIRNAAAYVVKRIEDLPQDRASHRDVIECWEAMQLILTDLHPPEPAGTAAAGK
jgi:hypothetical protein